MLKNPFTNNIDLCTNSKKAKTWATMGLTHFPELYQNVEIPCGVRVGGGRMHSARPTLFHSCVFTVCAEPL